MSGYVRQSTAEILPSLVILADSFNKEFNALQLAFNSTTGHTHDGTTGNGPKINLTTSVSGVLPFANGGTGGIVSVDNTLARFDGTDGTLQTSPIVVSDVGGVTGVNTLDISTTSLLPFTVTTIENGASAGPVTLFIRDSASPAVNDVLGYLGFQGRNSTNVLKTYSDIYTLIADPTNASEDGTIVIRNTVAGTSTIQAQVTATGWNSMDIGATTAGTGTFTTLTATGSFISTASTNSFRSTDAGAAAGPVVALYRDSASPAVNDILGYLQFVGNDSAGNSTEYGAIRTVIADPINGSEDGNLVFSIIAAGAINTMATVTSTGWNGMDIGVTTPGIGTFTTLGAETLTLTSTDAGASAGPILSLSRASASPAASDVLGYLSFGGRDSAGNATEYAVIRTEIVDPTNGSEDGKLVFLNAVAGVTTTQAEVTATGWNSMDIGQTTAGLGTFTTLTATSHALVGGATSGGGSDVTPSGSNGQLRIAGNGYQSYIANDANGTYLGNNSAVRNLFLQTNAVTRATITSTGINSAALGATTASTVRGTTFSSTSGLYSHDIDTSLVVYAGGATVGGQVWCYGPSHATNANDVRIFAGASTRYLWDNSAALHNYFNPISVANGSATDPSYTFTSDTDTGLYYISANTFGVATNGVLLASFTSAALEMANGKNINMTGIGPGTINIGTFSSGGSNIGKQLGQITIDSSTSGTASNKHQRFYNPNGEVGSISTSASSTAYTTSSDYRLKTDIEAFEDSGEILEKLRPVSYTWIKGGTRDIGFIAHEVQEIFPTAVTGEKDGVDDGGNPNYQGGDWTKLVPVLVAELKSLRKRVAELESKNG